MRCALPAGVSDVSRSHESYFWAGGRKQFLSGTDDIAIVVRNAAEAIGQRDIKRLRGRGQPFGDTLIVVAQTDLDDETMERLRRVGAVQPVYRSDDEVRVVVLPEVRVEEADPVRKNHILDLVHKGVFDGVLIDEKPGRLTLSPTSGNGDDALKLANQLVEQLHPDAVSPRFLRLVPRPDHRRRA